MGSSRSREGVYVPWPCALSPCILLTVVVLGAPLGEVKNSSLVNQLKSPRVTEVPLKYSTLGLRTLPARPGQPVNRIYANWGRLRLRSRTPGTEVLNTGAPHGPLQQNVRKSMVVVYRPQTVETELDEDDHRRAKRKQRVCDAQMRPRPWHGPPPSI